MITLSSITPASSVFIIIPAILLGVGTGSFLALAFAALVGVFMAFCWGELCAAYPIAGGDYAVVWHAFKGRAKPLAGPVSMVLFALWIDTIVFIPAVIALGTAQYLGVVWTVNTKMAGAVVMLLAAGLAILRVRVNAVLTGIMLGIEMLALGIVTVLGVVNLHTDRIGSLFHDWQIGNGHGGTDPVAFSAILAITAVAVFAYNGYAAPVNLSEETQGSSRRDRQGDPVVAGHHRGGRADPDHRGAARRADAGHRDHRHRADERVPAGDVVQHGQRHRLARHHRGDPQRGRGHRHPVRPRALLVRPRPRVAGPGQRLDVVGLAALPDARGSPPRWSACWARSSA